jgi:hypothetical protein
MTTDLISAHFLGTARLWDKDFNLLASEPCDKPSNDTVKVHGKGALHDTIKAILSAGSMDDPLHITYDPDPNQLEDWRNRRSGRVAAVDIEERLCECGRTIVDTTISGIC